MATKIISRAVMTEHWQCEEDQAGPMSKAQNSKRTSKCQVFFFTVLKNTQKLDRIGAPGPASADHWRPKRETTLQACCMYAQLHFT